MPDTIRTTVESFGAHPQHSGLRAAAVILAALSPFEAASAREAGGAFEGSTIDAYISALLLIDRHEVAALGLTLGILCFAVITAILLVRTRRRLAAVTAGARDQAIASRSAIDRAYALILSEPQILIAWSAAGDDPEIIGDPTLLTGTDAPQHILSFGAWLAPQAAHDMERSVDALRARGVGFAMTVSTLINRIIEAEGQVIGGRAILRLREVSGIKYELAELAQRHRKQIDDAWYDARFGGPSNDPKVVAARHALTCGPGKDLIRSVDAKLTPGRFLSNVLHSVSYTRLHVPTDPRVAERDWC
jgi:hypothetical protein